MFSFIEPLGLLLDQQYTGLKMEGGGEGKGRDVEAESAVRREKTAGKASRSEIDAQNEKEEGTDGIN